MGCVQSEAVDNPFRDAGDQRGVLVVTATTVLYTGDVSTVWLPNDTLNSITSVRLVHDALVSDIRSGTAYFLANAMGMEALGAEIPVTQLIELTPEGIPVVPQRAIQLSVGIPLAGNVSFFSGYGRIVIWTSSGGGGWYQIAMPSGVVTRLASVVGPISPFNCESWSSSGIAEFFNGELHAVFMSSAGNTGVVRQRISDNAVTVLAMAAPGDVCSIGISPTRNRWYSQYEGAPSYVAAMAGEHVVSCPATWDSP